VLKRVELPADAAAQMDLTRRESAEVISRDSLAFVDKCQGRLSRLPACAGVVRQRCEPSRRPP
jgi:hypothetical protein